MSTPNPDGRALALAELLEWAESQAIEQADGLTDADLLHRPENKANPGHWTLGHIASSINWVRRSAGMERSGPELYRELFNKPFDAARVAEYPTADTLRGFIREVFPQTREHLLGMSAEALAKTTGSDNEKFSTVGKTLRVAIGHLIYHCGQLGTIRKLTGHTPSV
jgi:uncharacterized damage-inducible protein DinB